MAKASQHFSAWYDGYPRCVCAAEARTAPRARVPAVWRTAPLQRLRIGACAGANVGHDQALTPRRGRGTTARWRRDGDAGRARACDVAPARCRPRSMARASV
jgi:hypothetical protein